MKIVCRTTGKELHKCTCARCNPHKEMQYLHSRKSKPLNQGTK